MDFSSFNASLWNGVIQFGLLAVGALVANVMRRKIPFIRKSLMPTAVLGGFLLLLAKTLGIMAIDPEFLEMLTYHAIAIGFIALSLRNERNAQNADKGSLTGLKSGAIIIALYIFQGIMGLGITLALAYTIMPEMFAAAGLLLPMGYGQGPGQANNVGATYEALGFAGGRSFGLAIAAAGYLCACIVGVIYLNYLKRKGRINGITGNEVVDGVSITTFQDQNEIPIAESIDKLSIQIFFAMGVYVLTFLVTDFLASLVETALPGFATTLVPLLWGFNFIIGSVLAMGVREVMKLLSRGSVMTRQYHNNYLLSRISGFAFDVMILGAIASINIGDLKGLWLPFALLAVAGGIGTYWLLKILCKKIYRGYEDEGFVSMYGMLCGTISSGVLLLRELDPDYETPAANNLIVGSSFAIVLGAPLMILIGVAPESPWLVMGLMVLYLAALLLLIYKAKSKKRP